MIFFKGEKVSPQKGEKGWYIPDPFIIIGKEYSYNDNLDYEGFIVKEITDKRGKKVPIIGIKVHECLDLKCGGSCPICGKENPHDFLVKGYKPLSNSTHLEIEVCKKCGKSKDVERYHKFSHSFTEDKVIFKCLCGYCFEKEISWDNLGDIPEDVPLKTLEKRLGLEGMIEEAKKADPESADNLWEKGCSISSKVTDLKAVVEDSVRVLENSVYINIEHKPNGKAVVSLSNGEVSIWEVDSILPYDSGDYNEDYSPNKEGNFYDKELPLEKAVQLFFKGTKYEGKTYEELLKMYEEFKQKEIEIKAQIEAKRKELLSLKMFKLYSSEEDVWNLQRYIFMGGSTDIIGVSGAVSRFQKIIKNQNL